MDFVLSDIDVRVLGSLIEKKMSTPEYYPLSLNSLTNACNQKSSRNPVVNYDEKIVHDAIRSLKDKGLLSESYFSRATKYEELFSKNYKLLDKESAVLCVLLLRGSQTAGEIRGRTERLYNFESLEDLNITISNLEEWKFIIKVPRQPGQKEQRFVHLLSGMPDLTKTGLNDNNSIIEEQKEYEKLNKLEEDVKSLRIDLDSLKQAFVEFKNQF